MAAQGTGDPRRPGRPTKDGAPRSKNGKPISSRHQPGESSVVKKILLLLVVVAVGLLIAKQIAGREH